MSKDAANAKDTAKGFAALIGLLLFAWWLLPEQAESEMTAQATAASVSTQEAEVDVGAPEEPTLDDVEAARSVLRRVEMLVEWGQALADARTWPEIPSDPRCAEGVQKWRLKALELRDEAAKLRNNWGVRVAPAAFLASICVTCTSDSARECEAAVRDIREARAFLDDWAKEIGQQP